MENITVDDIAAALGLSRSYFSKLVKKMTQKSPQEYLLAYRINKSCALLRTTELSIGEIALLVGYSNQFHFSRAFKNYMQQVREIISYAFVEDVLYAFKLGIFPFYS